VAFDFRANLVEQPAPLHRLRYIDQHRFELQRSATTRYRLGRTPYIARRAGEQLGWEQTGTDEHSKNPHSNLFPSAASAKNDRRSVDK
jgi:hypothetical protein